jgi:lipopolysaccharide transport system permease protein
LIVFNLFSEVLTRSPGLIVANSNYVKRVVFPLEILPLVGLLSALFHALVSLLVWLLAHALLLGWPPLTLLYLPLVLTPFALFTLGVSWSLASLGVYLRDVAQIIGVLVTAMMFLSPLFYPASSIPESFRLFLYLNPLTPAMELTRDVLYWGSPPPLGPLLAFWVAGAAVAWLGFAWFQKTRKGFADVL